MSKTVEMNKPDMPSETTNFAAKLKHIIFSFRPEEFIALAAFFPMAYLTFKAYFFFKAQGYVPKLFIGDMQRLGAVVIVIIIAYIITRQRSDNAILSFLRDILPFAYCLAIYTNLHDTVHFANPNDIHNYLIAIDQWLFGCQPCVWSQQFVHPWLTEIFSFCYMIFFMFAPIVAIVLLIQKRRQEFRETIVTVILCFYCGYFLYVLFPAVPPRLTLKHLYTVNLDGAILTNVANQAINMLPSWSRCAFPSLHSAVTLLSLMFAWKYTKTTFWIILPFCIGLILSTVYLRHHYVIDIFAGWALAIPVFVYIPKFDKWWQGMIRKHSS
ncbi:MAG: inositol phosphorylceramide synthase [candidate division Zixibacteria bacterium]|nr:inositol phosphorylceramide synthase [candidate division Zixibacteria bacterium]